MQIVGFPMGRLIYNINIIKAAEAWICFHNVFVMVKLMLTQFDTIYHSADCSTHFQPPYRNPHRHINHDSHNHYARRDQISPREPKTHQSHDHYMRRDQISPREPKSHQLESIKSAADAIIRYKDARIDEWVSSGKHVHEKYTASYPIFITA